MVRTLVCECRGCRRGAAGISATNLFSLKPLSPLPRPAAFGRSRPGLPICLLSLTCACLVPRLPPSTPGCPHVPDSARALHGAAAYPPPTAAHPPICCYCQPFRQHLSTHFHDYTEAAGGSRASTLNSTLNSLQPGLRLSSQPSPRSRSQPPPWCRSQHGPWCCSQPGPRCRSQPGPRCHSQPGLKLITRPGPRLST